MLREIQYRTFDELLDSVRIDLRVYDVESMINSQELIKVVQRVNKDLGLKINPSKSKAIEVYNGKAKLPSDFYVLNFAVVCGEEVERDYSLVPAYKTFEQGYYYGMHETEDLLKPRMVKQYTERTTINPGYNTITHNLNTRNIIIQCFGIDNTIIGFEVQVMNLNEIRVISDLATPIDHVKVVIMGAESTYSPLCQPDNPCPPNPVLMPIPLEQLPCCTTVSTEGGCPVVNVSARGKTKQYHKLIPLTIYDNKSITVDEVNFNKPGIYNAVIKNGYIQTNFDTGLIYINYQGALEDEFGNLLTFDDPKVNDYYEYALKQRIFENLFFADETVVNKLKLVEQRLRESRNIALGYVNTPDFHQMLWLWKANRRAMYSKYYDMFKSHTPLRNG